MTSKTDIQKTLKRKQKKLVKALAEVAEAEKSLKNEIIKTDVGGLFFSFHQNNSGGYFHDNVNVCEIVVIEAANAVAANARAEDIGIYFDGDRDCDCCGPRWYPLWGSERGDDVPSDYGKPLVEHDATHYRSKAIVYYADGTKEVVHFKRK